MPEPVDDHFLTRREADLLIASTGAASEARAEAHLREHRQEADALTKAIEAEARVQVQHDTAHGKAHDAHEEKHQAAEEGVRVALAALARERAIHAEAHEREHHGHQREHGLNNLAIDKAEAATDKRFIAVNGTRAQMEDMLRTLTSQDAFNALASEFTRYREDSRKDADRRFEEFRTERERRFSELHLAVTNIEKGDVKEEGRGLGQAGTIAAIVGTVAFATTLIGLVIVVANVVTGAR